MANFHNNAQKMKTDSNKNHNQFYEKWGGKVYENSIGRFFKSKYEKLATKIITTFPTPHILDIACGPGQLLEILQRKFPKARLFGLDLSTAMIKRLKEKLPEVETKIGDAENLPWPSNHFDIVTNTISFHHFPDPHKALKEMHRVLKPDGTLFLMDLIPKTRLGKIIINMAGKIGDATIDEGHVSVYTKSEIKKMLHAAGFKKVDQINTGIFSTVKINICRK